MSQTISTYYAVVLGSFFPIQIFSDVHVLWLYKPAISGEPDNVRLPWVWQAASRLWTHSTCRQTGSDGGSCRGWMQMRIFPLIFIRLPSPSGKEKNTLIWIFLKSCECVCVCLCACLWKRENERERLEFELPLHKATKKKKRIHDTLCFQTVCSCLNGIQINGGPIN